MEIYSECICQVKIKFTKNTVNTFFLSLECQFGNTAEGEVSCEESLLTLGGPPGCDNPDLNLRKVCCKTCIDLEDDTVGMGKYCFLINLGEMLNYSNVFNMQFLLSYSV